MNQALPPFRAWSPRLRAAGAFIVAVSLIFGGLAMSELVSSLGHDHEVTAAAHHDSGSCPDEGPDGAPCDRDCTCLCCPGHGVAAGTDSAPLTAPANCRAHDGGLAALNPSDFVQDLFRPPQA